jgi:hypothetical protein
MPAQFLLHLIEQLPRYDGGHLDRYPFRTIPKNPFAADYPLAFAVCLRRGDYSVVVPRARVSLVFQHELVRPTGAGRNLPGFQIARDGNKSEVATCEHLED